MTLPPDELLRRLSATVRGDIAPAVGDEYTRTQTHMVGVILERVAKQVALAEGHAAAERADVAALLDDLAPVLGAAPTAVTAALQTPVSERTVASLGPLVEELYRWGIDQPAATRALALVRPVLRRDIDRRMEIAR